MQDALKSARGNRAKAARLLDTTERILGYASASTTSTRIDFERPTPPWSVTLKGDP